MELSLPQLLLIFVAGLLVSGFFSMLEAALISQDRHKLRHLADEGNTAATVMLELLANIDRLLAAILLCNNLANVVCATTAAIIVARLSGGWGGAIFVSTLAVTFLILIFGEISPKVIGVRHAQGISLACAKPVRLLLVLLRPIIAVANFFAGGLLRLAGQDKISDEKTKMNLRELRSIVRASALGAKAAEDSESGAHYRMMQKLLEFNETPLEKIMTPRRDIIGLNLADGEENIAAQIISAPFSKLPVFDGNIDGTVGFIDTRQAVTAERLDGGISAEKLRAMMTSPYFVPAGGAILRQMQNMRNSGQRIALAVNGTGRVVGMVTVSSFAFAVIGAPELPSGIKTDSGAFLVSADISLMQLGELFPHTALPTTSATTLNGLVQEHLGNIPDSALCLEIGEWRVEVTEVSKKAVIKARVFVVPQSSAQQR
ncbi:MAG: CNNM domain-containing protein [Candidatus Zeuxoniibacter abyssi]|nr:MAG: CNNM domain-containing protein [Candidatus Persebacteraceae bacterium AB1(2)]